MPDTRGACAGVYCPERQRVAGLNALYHGNRNDMPLSVASFRAVSTKEWHAEWAFITVWRTYRRGRGLGYKE